MVVVRLMYKMQTNRPPVQWQCLRIRARTGQRRQALEAPEAVEGEEEHAELREGWEALQSLESICAQVQVAEAGEGAVGQPEAAEGVGGEVEREKPREEGCGGGGGVGRGGGRERRGEALEAVGVEVNGPVWMGVGLDRGWLMMLIDRLVTPSAEVVAHLSSAQAASCCCCRSRCDAPLPPPEGTTRASASRTSRIPSWMTIRLGPGTTGGMALVAPAAAALLLLLLRMLPALLLSSPAGAGAMMTPRLADAWAAVARDGPVSRSVDVMCWRVDQWGGSARCALCTVHLPIQLLSTHTSKRRSVARTELAMRCLWSRFQLAAPCVRFEYGDAVSRSIESIRITVVVVASRSRHASSGIRLQTATRRRLSHLAPKRRRGRGGRSTWAFYFLPSIDPLTQTQSIRSAPPSRNRLNQHPTPSSQSRRTGSASEAGAQQAAARPPSVSPNPLRSVGHRHHDGVNQRQHPRHHSSSGSSSHDGPHAAQQPPARAAPPVAPPRRRGAAGPGRPRLPGRGQLG